MKSNITLKLDSALLREIRVMAAEEGTSISALLAARLEQIVRERKTYERARKRALARLREGLICNGPLPVPATRYTNGKSCPVSISLIPTSCSMRMIAPRV